MKLKIYSAVVLASLLFAACDEVNEQVYEGGSLTSNQLQDVNQALPVRAVQWYVFYDGRASGSSQF